MKLLRRARSSLALPRLLKQARLPAPVKQALLTVDQKTGIRGAGLVLFILTPGSTLVLPALILYFSVKPRKP